MNQSMECPEIEVGHEMASHIETFDGGRWIDTNTLEVLPTRPVEMKQNGLVPLRWKQALRMRWQIWLEDHLPDEGDLRMVSREGFWISPLDGEPVASVPVIDGLIDHRVIDSMAHHLASLGGCDPRDFGATIGASLNAEHCQKSESARRATKVQRNVTIQAPEVSGWNMGVFYQAMEEVGGDFIETIMLPDNRFLLALGDVCGHGIQGAVLGAGAGHLLRGLAFHHHDLGKLCADFHRGMARDFLPGGFLTCWICLVDVSTGRYQSVSLGHCPPFMLDLSDGVAISRSQGRGAALGLLKREQFEHSLEVENGYWKPGATMVICSDGLDEHGPSPDRQFGIEGVVSETLECADKTPQELVDHLAAHVRQWAGREFVDDVSILAVRRESAW